MTSSRVVTVAAVLVVLGPALAWLGLVPPLAGFGLYVLGGLTAVVFGLVSVIRMLRGRGIAGPGALAVVVMVVFVAVLVRHAGAPRINDYTTDLADPPAFVHAATLPPNVGRDLAYPAAFAEVQRGCCADLAPLRLAAPPERTLATVQRVAGGMPGWTVTSVDPGAGALEAVATSRLFRFQDDIVVRVRPDGDGSRVDVRSKSRDGKGDLGANAARIRTFLAALTAAAGTP